jgi:hypothetical protein
MATYLLEGFIARDAARYWFCSLTFSIAEAPSRPGVIAGNFLNGSRDTMIPLYRSLYTFFTLYHKT